MAITNHRPFFNLITMLKQTLLFCFVMIQLSVCAQFTPEKIISTTANGTRAIDVKDIDNDGFLDIISANGFGNNITWYKNLGDGTFNEQTVTPLLTFPLTVYTSDLDNDGDQDVISASFSDDKVVWYENLNGLGIFGVEQLIDATNADGAYFVKTADLDNDGDQDVLLASDTFDDVHWYENDNSGNFSNAQPVADSNNNGRSLDIGDMDGDNDLDVVMTSSGDEILSWSKNLDGQGTFSIPMVLAPQALATSSVFLVDLDTNGSLDILTVAPANDKLSWYRNQDGQGDFSEEVLINDFLGQPINVSAADLDNDGDNDIMVAYAEGDSIAWLENLDGLGNFGPRQELNNNTDAAFYVLAADLDNDGDQDVVSASRNDDKIAWYENLTVTLGTQGFDDVALDIYPNPTKSILHFKTETPLDTMQIFDITGQLLATYKNIRETISLKKFTSGVYLVKCYIGSRVIAKKVVKL